MVSTISSFLYATLSRFFLLLESFYIFEPVIGFSYGQVYTAEKFNHVTHSVLANDIMFILPSNPNTLYHGI